MTSGIARRATVLAAGALLSLSVNARGAHAQSSLETVLQQYSGATIEGYIKPLAEVLIANLSSGYVTGAGHKKGFTFGLELVGVAAKVDDALRLYDAATPNGFDPATINTPTVFGGTAQAVPHNSIPGLSYRGSDGLLDIDYFLTPAPQLRLGGFMGTEVVVRWASSAIIPLEDEDFPDITLLGFGVQHSISQYFPDLLFDVAVGGSYNSFKFGDIVDVSGLSFGLHAGKDFGMVGLFAGLASEGGSMKLKYTSEDPDAPGAVDLDLDVDRIIRFMGGASLNLGPLKLFGDASFGDVNTYSVGLRIGS